MALTYKNTQTGQVVSMLEPPEVQAKADAEAERLARGGTKKAQRQAEVASEAGRKQAIHVRHTIERMDESETWQRVSDQAVATAVEEPDLDELRAEAEELGIEVSPRWREARLQREIDAAREGTDGVAVAGDDG